MTRAETVQIEVDGIIERAGRWSVVDTEKNWYGFNRDRPPFDKGDTVQFEYTLNGKFRNADIKSVMVVSSAAAKPNSSKTARASDVMSKDDYWSRKEASDKYTQREIRYQASRNAAIEFLKIALEQQAIPLGSKKAADKEDILLQYLDNYTNMFYTSTYAIRERSEDMVAAERVDGMMYEEGDELDGLS